MKKIMSVLLLLCVLLALLPAAALADGADAAVDTAAETTAEMSAEDPATQPAEDLLEGNDGEEPASGSADGSAEAPASEVLGDEVPATDDANGSGEAQPENTEIIAQTENEAETVAEAETSSEMNMATVTSLEGAANNATVVALELVGNGNGHVYWENCDGYTAYHSDGITTYYKYKIWEGIQSLYVRVKYSDGSSELVELRRSLFDQMYRPVENLFYDRTDQDSDPWTVGGNNKITIEYRGCTLDIPVTVVANPVQSIEVTTPESDRYVYDESEYRSEAAMNPSSNLRWYDGTDFLKKLTLRLNYTDGKHEDVALEDMVGDFAEGGGYDFEGFYINGHVLTACTNQKAYGNVACPGRGTVDWDVNDATQERTITLSYANKTVTVSGIRIEETPVARISVLSTNGFYYVEGYDCIVYRDYETGDVVKTSYVSASLLSQLTLRVVYKDGKAPSWATGTDKDGLKYYDWVIRDTSAPLDDSELYLYTGDTWNGRPPADAYLVYDNVDLNCGTNTVHIHYKGRDAELPVEVKSVQGTDVIESVEIIDPVDYRFWNGVHELYPYNMKVRVSFKDGRGPVEFLLDESLVWTIISDPGYESSYAFVPALGYTIDLVMDKKLNTSCVGKVTVLGVESDNSFNYMILGSENIVASACLNPFAADTERMFVVAYDNGMFYSFSLQGAEKMTDTSLMKNFSLRLNYSEYTTGYNKIDYYKKVDPVTGALSYYEVLSKTDELNGLVRLWLSSPSSWKHSCNGSWQPRVVYSRGLCASLLQLNGVVYGSVGGEYIKPEKGENLNEQTTVTGDCITIAVKGTGACTNTRVSISGTATASLGKENTNVALETGVTTVQFDADTMDELADANDSILTLGISQTDGIPTDLGLPREIESGAVLEVTLTGDGSEKRLSDVAADRDIELSLPLPEELEGEAEIYVYYHADDGSLTQMPAVVDSNGILHITTSHFSRFVITGDKVEAASKNTPTAASKSSPKTGDEAMPFLWVAATTMAALSIAYVSARKRKN